MAYLSLVWKMIHIIMNVLFITKWKNWIPKLFYEIPFGFIVIVLGLHKGYISLDFNT